MNERKTKKLDNIIDLCWCIIIIGSFWGEYLLSINIPGIGEMMPFRSGILIVWMLLLMQKIIKREKREMSILQKWCVAFAVVFVLYGCISLIWSIDFSYSLKYVVNAFFMVSFFVMFVVIFEREHILCISQGLIIINMIVIMALGIYEVFCGGIFNDCYNDWKRVLIFGNIYQYPVVTSGNTNNYVAQLLLLLLGIVLLLAYHIGNKKYEKIKKIVIMLCFPACFFLINAAKARLVLMAFILMCIVYAVGMLVIDKANYKIILLTLIGILGVWAVFAYSDKDRTDTLGMKELNTVIQSASEEQIDMETGGEAGGEISSVEKRYNLLIHAMKTFVESNGLGAGVGNTDMLAKEKNVADGTYNIHCFFARILGDYGIFVIIPLLGIGYNLVKKSIIRLKTGIKIKNKETIGQETMFLGSFIPFVIASTAPSDAQNLESMWIFVAILVIITGQKKTEKVRIKEY